MDFVLLGTGAGVPAKARNVTAIALQLLEERGTVWLFDCGEATQHQILKTAVKPRKIEKIFITHLHGDHIFGLPGLLSSRSFQGGVEKLTVYGPKGIDAYITTSLQVSGTHLKYPLEIIEIEEGIVFEDEQFTVTALSLDHGIYSVGYRIVEKDRPGSLLVDQLLQEGVKPGPLFKALKNGEMVRLDDGRVLNGKDYLGDPQKGRIITVLGDTRVCSNALILAESADFLVHEATFSAEETEMASAYFHSTTVQAAETAMKAGAKQLILTHISSRYTLEDSERLKEESKAIFANTIMAEDLMAIKIPLYVEE
ncbi:MULTISPECIES: ribonuclease Z [Peribacillus]|uniref:ribonuclease Z n=1 Tax=Peribacillus TaxID=2675229 RepID=UPI00191317F5|nr:MULTISPECIES: ribonuclease Z [unclassified Peribacillus]MBK5462791.1 ribonuclease Z [Peribacillus sp. TH27]MBK5483870.1 ribonuclease Z [Peribacillus sp. TH16]MBK5500972.1 ribonuclease Z [Peribacillus sp. TH14]MBK5442461.1 ribonuclease Z [Peribacillus sp. TH24]WMX54050.1 ribonuclease Z [Peribacillus sp. R9-11]